MTKQKLEEKFRLEIINENDWICDGNLWGYSVQCFDHPQQKDTSGGGVYAYELDNHYILRENNNHFPFGICEINNKQEADNRLYQKVRELAKNLQSHETYRYTDFKWKNKFPFLFFEDKEIVPEIIDKTERTK